MDGGIFRPIFVPDRFREAVSGRSWLQAMLDAEAALATAEARVSLISHEAAAAISSCCDAARFDPEEPGRKGRAAGNPVPPLVEALTGAVSEVSGEAARHVHRGATSQDIVDTAAMLVARRGLDLILAELEGISHACARLAEEHRGTIMAGRTLLQQALPTTFGLKAAGWLVSVLEGRRRLLDVRERGLAAQFGGAAGTLASLGESGVLVLGEFARELGLAEPTVPWQTDRTRIAEVGGALSLVAGVLGKISLDVILMAQTEVGEVAEPAAEGRGGSSTLPHKRNPILSVTASANVRRVQALAQTLYPAMVGEHERAAGAWHAEWEALSDALALTGGATAAVREVTEGLEVHPEKMRQNLDETGGMLMAENVTTVVADRLGRLKAHDLVEKAAQRAAGGGKQFREELLAEPALREWLSAEEVDAALDPAGYFGSAGEFIDRALGLYRGEVLDHLRPVVDP
jgi:3-carboxy-cis,cis-muconate cycloisomerase